MLLLIVGSGATLLILFAAATGTGVITTDFSRRNRLGLNHFTLSKQPVTIDLLEQTTFMMGTDSFFGAKAGNKFHLTRLVTLKAFDSIDDFKT